MESKARHWIVLIWLTLILAFGSAVRVWHIDEVRNVDEPNIINRAAEYANGKFHISWYNWPAQSLIRLDGTIFAVLQDVMSVTTPSWDASIKANFKTHETTFRTFAHLVTVFFALQSVLLVFGVGFIVRGPIVGLGSALFLSASYLHTVHSRFATPDVPTTAAFLAVLMLSILLLQARSITRREKIFVYGCAGLVSGFALATKYTGLLAIVPLATVHVVLFWRSVSWQLGRALRASRELFNWPLCIFALAMIASHTFFHPFFFVDLNIIIQDILFEAKGERLGVDWAGQGAFLKNVIYYTRGNLFWNGLGISIIAGVTLFFSFFRLHTRRWQSVALIGCFYLVTLFGLSSLGLHWSRWAVPFSPLIAVAAAVGCFEIFNMLRKCKVPHTAAVVIITIVVTAVTFPPVLLSYSVGRETARSVSTAQVMSDYIRAHIPPGSRIVSDTYYLKLSKAYRLSEPRILLYVETLQSYRDRGVQYVVVKPIRKAYAAQQPEKYAAIIAFFEELNTSATKVTTVTKKSKTILDHKRDDKLYHWLFLRDSSVKNFDATKGKTLELYKIQ